MIKQEDTKTNSLLKEIEQLKTSLLGSTAQMLSAPQSKKNSDTAQSLNEIFLDMIKKLQLLTRYKSIDEIHNHINQVREYLFEQVSNKNISTSKDCKLYESFIISILNLYEDVLIQEYHLLKISKRTLDEDLFETCMTQLEYNGLTTGATFLETQQKLNKLSSTYELLADIFSKKGYIGASATILIEDQEIFLPQNHLASLRAAPVINEMNEKLNDFEKNEKSLRNNLEQLENIDDYFDELHQCWLEPYRILEKNLNDEVLTQKNQMNLIGDQLQNFSKLEFSVLDKEEISLQLSHLKQCAKQIDPGVFASKSWTRLSEKIEKNFKGYQEKENTFCNDVDRQNEMYGRLSLLLARNNERIDDIYIQGEGLSEKINTFVQLLRGIQHKVKETHDRLLMHFKSHESSYGYVKNFLADHKASLLLSGVGGSGLGATGVVLTGLSMPIALASLAGGAIGLGFGGGVGAARDMRKEAKNERASFDTTTKPQATFSIWKKRSEAPVDISEPLSASPEMKR